MDPVPSSPPARIRFDLWLKQLGRTRATGQNWRRALPWLDVVDIFGKLYISTESVRRFEEMAARGELAGARPTPPAPRRRATAPRGVKFGPPRKETGK